MAEYHIIIDFMHIYYRNWFRCKGSPDLAGAEAKRVREETVKGTVQSLAAVLKRAAFEYDITEAAVSICFDMPSSKQQKYPEYKAKRKHSLLPECQADIAVVAAWLAQKGYNVCRAEGYEADDLIYSLLQTHPYEHNVIVTNDSDLMMHLSANTELLFIGGGFAGNNYSRIRSLTAAKNVIKREIKFNDIAFYKCCVGDTSDNISGIERFGAKAYERLLAAGHVTEARTKDELRSLGDKLFTGAQNEQYMRSLELVYPQLCESVGKPNIKAIG